MAQTHDMAFYCGPVTIAPPTYDDHMTEMELFVL